MKNLLIVGGTGFIGYHLLKEAQKRKYKVTSISLNRPKKLRSVAKKGHLKSHKIFNNKLIAEFIVKKTMNLKFDSNINWCNV